ncbi:MAG: hypothetical protein ACE5IH_05245 [Thermodesulfobacteriota bacterium]
MYDGTVIPKNAGRFILLFLCLFFVFYVGSIKLLPDFFLIGAINLTGYLVVLVSKALAIPAFYKNAHVTVSGFRMLVHLECTALQFLAIFFAGILAYPLHNIRYKVIGLLFGGIFIIAINILRIVILGLIGANFPVATFNFVHIYLWQGAFVMLVSFTWFVWVNKVFIFRLSLRFCGIALITSAAAILGLGFVMEPYLRFLASISEKLFWITALLSTTDNLFIKAAGDSIMFQYAGNRFNLPILWDVYSSTIFFAFIFASSNITNMAGLAKRVLQGIGVLSVMYLLFVVVTGHLVIHGVGDELMWGVMWIIRGTALVTPILLGFYLRKGIETDNSEKEVCDERVIFST